MGNAGSVYGNFRTAIRTGSYTLACQVARELPRVGLREALQLTLLAAEKDPDRYERMARRWMARFLEEKQPTLQLTQWVAEDLRKLGESELPEVFKADSMARLREVAAKL